MRRNMFLIFLMIGLLFTSGCTDWKSRLSPSGTVAVTFIDNLVNEDYEAAYSLFSSGMQSYYGESLALQGEWENNQWILGPYQSYTLHDFSFPSQGIEQYDFRVSFSRGKCTLEIVVQNGQIYDFLILNMELSS